MIFTYADVEQRQRLIDRLLQELEGRANAIQKIGQDLVLCKERNTKLEEKTLMLEDKLRESEIRTTKLLNTVDIQDIPRDELEKRYSSMAQRLQNEIIAKRELSVKLEIAQLAQIERNDIEKKYLEMQQAHLAQQQKLQELQGGNNVISHYKATIEKQEHVIAKLGSYLKEKMPETVQRKIDDAINSNNTEDVEINLYRVLADENALLKRQILELETTKDVSNQLSTSNKMLSISSSSFSDSQYLEVLMRAETSETRVSVLEAELAKNARKFACQLADMQKKLTERSSQQRTPEYSILKDIKPENIVRRRQVSWSRDSQSPPGGKAASAKPVPSHRSHPQLPQTHPLKQRLSKRESDLYF
ncbi:hypothetical protein BC830DRAFT_887257 [Chytriomyces sp. MP71]|nr:hypothetical protein BC830DRAFT_887257 [Chytriomyces sp. MP71]